MSFRRLEASRVLAIPATPYCLHAEHLPFALVFARTREVPSPAQKKADPPEPPQPDDPPEPPQPEATSSDPETTTPDSNDPANDEEIDWMQDD